MPHEMYKDATILCKAEFDEVESLWFLAISIAWQVSEHLHWHTMTPPKSFETETEAMAEGFRLAELWVDNKLLG